MKHKFDIRENVSPLQVFSVSGGSHDEVKVVIKFRGRILPTNFSTRPDAAVCDIRPCSRWRRQWSAYKSFSFPVSL